MQSQNEKMDKAKQIIASIGGFLSALLLFFGTINVRFDWFNPDTIDAFLIVLVAGLPLGLALYGVYKNSYLFTEKAKKQEDELKKRGLK